MIASPSAASSRIEPSDRPLNAAEQIADHQAVLHLLQAALRLGAHRGVRLVGGVGQRLQSGAGFRLARFAQQPHRIETHLRIAVGQLQVSQRRLSA